MTMKDVISDAIAANAARKKAIQELNTYVGFAKVECLTAAVVLKMKKDNPYYNFESSTAIRSGDSYFIVPTPIRSLFVRFLESIGKNPIMMKILEKESYSFEAAKQLIVSDIIAKKFPILANENFTYPDCSVIPNKTLSDEFIYSHLYRDATNKQFEANILFESFEPLDSTYGETEGEESTTWGKPKSNRVEYDGVLDTIDISYWCDSCGHDWQSKSMPQECPKCGEIVYS